MVVLYDVVHANELELFVEPWGLHACYVCEKQRSNTNICISLMVTCNVNLGQTVASIIMSGDWSKVWRSRMPTNQQNQLLAIILSSSTK